jgi:hypothetical protein
MSTITIVRHIPPPIIGMCGVSLDRSTATLESDLDWLEALGVVVERLDPDVDSAGIARHEAARNLLSTQGRDCLPLVLVDEAIVSHGRYPTRTALAHLAGQARRAAGRAQ